jgi:hypothetical protein
LEMHDQLSSTTTSLVLTRCVTQNYSFEKKGCWLLSRMAAGIDRNKTQIILGGDARVKNPHLSCLLCQ